MTTPQLLTAHIPEELAGQRLDQALAQLFPAYSRARLQQWIRAGEVRVDEQQWRGRDKVRGGEAVEISVVLKPEGAWQSEPIALDIVYEDAALLVINKPAGLVVHPGAGNPQGTLLNALLHHAPELMTVPRAGIVHRLDKDTSGLLMVARTLPAQKSLVKQLHARSVERIYDAVVIGVMTAGGRIEAALERHPVQRTRMAVAREGTGRWRLRIIGLPGVFVVTPVSACNWKPVARIRFAPTWRISVTPLRGIPPTVAAWRSPPAAAKR